MQFRSVFVVKAVPCLRQLVFGFSPRKAGFNPRSVNVRFLVKKNMALGQIFLQVIRFSSVSIISPMFHTHHLHVFLTRRTNERSLGTFQKSFFLIGEHWIEKHFVFLALTWLTKIVLATNSDSGVGLPFCHAIYLFQQYLTMAATLLHIQKAQSSNLGS